jgi:hypothetical protein
VWQYEEVSHSIAVLRTPLSEYDVTAIEALQMRSALRYQVQVPPAH